MRSILLAGCCLALMGCQSAPIVGAAAGGGIIATVLTLRSDANLGLTAIKPLNADIVCPIAEKQPHDAKTTAAIKAFCANLPTTVEGIAVQAVAIVAAVNAAGKASP
jgi:hypothetical protein